MRYKNFKAFSDELLTSEQSIVQIKKEAPLRMALVFPNEYTVGMSNLGFQQVYRLLNAHPEVTCERFFLYPPPLQNVTRSLETGRELREFDLVAFSVSFELDYLNILHILNQAQIPLLSVERTQWHPLIICGGVITMLNPTPLAPIMDLIVCGEAEPLLNVLITMIRTHKSGGLRTGAFFEQIARQSGFWVPSLPASSKQFLQIQLDQREHPIHSALISGQSHFKNMYLIEVGRACGRGCYFCAAGHVYRPIKFFADETIISLAQNNPFQTRYIGLVGSALSDSPHLYELCEKLVTQGFQIGLSSFRLDAINSHFISILEQGGIQNLTMAPEAGSERLRRLIHKQLTDDQIFAAFETVARSTLKSIKLYFMIGLPFEKVSDLAAIVELVSKATYLLPKSIHIAVSINAFIPKPMTPFQWAPMNQEIQLRNKRRYLYQQLRKLKRVSFSKKSSREEILQGLLSQGDFRVTPLLLNQIEQASSWSSIFKRNSSLLNSLIYREKRIVEPLPWDFLEGGVTKKILAQNWKRVKTGLD